VGIFSKAKSLDDLAPDVRQVLCPDYTPELVGTKEYQRFLKALLESENAIRLSIPRGEDLRLLIPCFKIWVAGQAGYEGLVAFTNRTVFHFGGSPFKMALTEIADVERLMHQDGYIIINIIGRDAQPYSQFRLTPGNSATRYWSNTISFNLPDPKIASYVTRFLESLR